MSQGKMIDHLFRHQYGKMVSILTRIFGLSNIEIIEDAVQDTFLKAVHTWKDRVPENPEAWLVKASKNRLLDILRKTKADSTRNEKIDMGSVFIAEKELFLDNEIEDSELRMIFTACHPILKPQDQITFALKTISGFSASEIATSLLLKPETIKKRLLRARKLIKENKIQFDIPIGDELKIRMESALQVLYLIFNEGFHSSRSDILIRKDLCGEAIRLCKIILKKKAIRNGSVYALFALMCFHAARLESKTNIDGDIIGLEKQDRKKWHQPLIALGNSAMQKASEDLIFGTYHYQAAIAWEHLIALTFEETRWDKILQWYIKLYTIDPSKLVQLNQAIICMQLNDLDKAYLILNDIKPEDLEQRAYLYYGALAEYHFRKEEKKMAFEFVEKAKQSIQNQQELKFFLAKIKAFI